MFGHRSDGYAVKGMDPVVALTPHIMPMRCDALVALRLELPFEPLARYIAEKRQQGSQITFMEIILAAYVRAVSQMPQANRFIANKRFYSRKEITVSFAVLQKTADGSDKENVAKCKFDPKDTIFDVAARIQEAIAVTRAEEASNATLKLATLLNHPLVASPIVYLARFLDRYGVMPKFLIEASPFHTGMFFGNNASVGLPPVFHHIYNFGTTSIFVIVGNVERQTTAEADGRAGKRRVLPLGVTADERVCAGITYSRFLSLFQQMINDPQKLEEPPKEVFYDQGHAYRLPPPRKA
ncbi:MAG TPA: 2-oxo acid dehydrogenase subunit E2 [Candidatus Limnocylindria bacterium]|nr:2-oxo acid dehydrogenase subunit E2 [Candidatus Limnocylindria bacterium]